MEFSKSGPAERNAFPHRKHFGYTLIELMIVVAIIALLARIAIPAYTRSVAKSRRAGAEACLSNYANYMERYYTTNLTYATMTNTMLTGLNLDCASSTNTGQYYSYSLTATPTQSTYTLQAVPQGAQSTNDAQCGTLTLDQSGLRGRSGSSDLNTCWAH